MPQSVLQVIEMAYSDDESYASTWHYLLNVDLIKTIQAYTSIDPPIWWMLSDPRRLIRRTRDGLWVRLVDVSAALARRQYMVNGDLTIKVEDDFCPWNAGVYGLESSGSDAHCERSNDTPDITIEASALASAFLGGANLHTLARAGLVNEHTDGAIARANTMFSWHTAPMTTAPEPLT